MRPMGGGSSWKNRRVRTLVFIPALNEEASIAGVIGGVHEHLPDADVLVIDDGSTDATADRAREAGAIVAPLPFNQGVGAAQQTGYLFALHEGYDICAQIDGDGQHPPQELARVVACVRDDDADMAVGSRYLDPDLAREGDYHASPMRELGIRLFRAIVSASTHQRFTDTTSGLRAINRRAMAVLGEGHSPEFADVESLQRAVHQGLRVKEIPVRMLPRAEGSSFLGPLHSLYYIYKTLVVLLVGHARPRGSSSGSQ
jgi:glycosyltransferase involved in cell wall biosynthesis